VGSEREDKKSCLGNPRQPQKPLELYLFLKETLLVGKLIVQLNKVSKVFLLGSYELCILITHVGKLELSVADKGVPSVLSGIGIGSLIEEADSILEELIEGGTNVSTDVLKHRYVTVKTACCIVGKVVVIVLVKYLSGVRGLIVQECGALCELNGRNGNTAGTTYNVDLSKILLIGIKLIIILVDRNGNNAESAAVTFLHSLVIRVLKRTNENNATKEDLIGGELLTYSKKRSGFTNRFCVCTGYAFNPLGVEEVVESVSEINEVLVLIGI
jgi:hypothetical protein